MNYIEVTFDITPYEEAVADALISELGTIGYDGFSYTDQGFTAYIPAKEYNAQAITRLEIFDFFTRNYRIETSVQEIEDQDWNKVWEENFTPIVVDDRILVRAGFHAPVPGIEYEILIEPKMSFGTGHHSTTALMLRTILDNKERITNGYSTWDAEQVSCLSWLPKPVPGKSPASTSMNGLTTMRWKISGPMV